MNSLLTSWETKGKSYLVEYLNCAKKKEQETKQNKTKTQLELLKS